MRPPCSSNVEPDREACGELIARTLTPAELRVLLGIVEIGGVPQTAENPGFAETTVETDLHRVFAKTCAFRFFSNPPCGIADCHPRGGVA